MSTIKVDTVRPVTTDASLTLQGDSSGSGVTGITIDSSGNVTLNGTANDLGTVSAGTLGSGVTFPAGHAIKIYSQTFRGIDSNGTNSYVIIGDGDADKLEIVTDTPKSSSSKFLIMVAIGAATDNGGATTAFRLTRGGSFITESGTDYTPLELRTASSFRIGGGDSNHPFGISFSFLDSPNSTSALTYAVQFKNQSSLTSYINRSSANSNVADTYGTYTSSTLTIFEIA